MRKIKEVLRLKWEQGLSNRQIAAACGVSRPTVSEYLLRLAEAGLSWPLPEDLGEARLEQPLFPPPPDLPAEVRGIPDWHQIHEELMGKYVTLFLLWQEYREANPEGYQYSWFCEHYRAWQGAPKLNNFHVLDALGLASRRPPVLPAGSLQINNQ